MAGISLELKKMFEKKSLLSIFTAFGYSFALSSGPYFITILSLILVNFLAVDGAIKDSKELVQFQVSVTYIIAFSLILNGFTNLYLIRFLADRAFEKKYEAIVPNIFGAISINMSVGFIISLPFAMFFIAPYASYYYALSFAFCFTVFMGIWTVNTILTGFKNYKYILFSFVFSYGIFIPLSYILFSKGLTGLMFAFTLSNILLFTFLISYLVVNYYSHSIISFDFIKEKKYRSLIFTGFFYNLGLWADKLVFWFNPYTNTPALGPLKYSVVYDIPIFLAYLSMAPGISGMFLKVEWEFSYYYERYYNAIRSGAVLEKIYLYGDELINSARNVIVDVLRIQAIFVIFILITQKLIFQLFKLPKVYIPLFDILLIGTSMQVSLLGVLALIFYINRLKDALVVTGFFAFTNLVFSFISIYLGPYFYGYGFNLSVILTSLLGIICLRRILHEIHYWTFMHI